MGNRILRRGAAGFTLTEMLVVIAITIIMMGLLLGPLTQTFNLTARGETMIAAQDNARASLQQITREMQDAMVVYDNLPINLWHYSAYDTTGNPPTPTPKADAVPVAYPVTGAMVDLVLPRMRFFCTQFNHYLNVVETARDGSLLDTRRVAIDTCPRPGHAGSPVELRPTDPLQPEEVRVRYFIGLEQPTVDPNDPNAPLPGSSSDRTSPHYANAFLFRNSTSPRDNLYVLYRVEFKPNLFLPDGTPDPAAELTSNWLLPNGQPNPNFFYDQRVIDSAKFGKRTFAQEWKSRAAALVTTQNTDLVRMVNQIVNGELTWRPEPATRFIGTPVSNETLDANTATATFEAAGIQGAPRPPTQYVADYGSWSGPNSDMSLPVTNSVILSSQPPLDAALARQFVFGPRIQVFEQSKPPTGGDRLDLVYDSGVPAAAQARQRLFTYDSRRGLVNFALRRFQFPAPVNADPETFVATVRTDYTTDLKSDMATAQITSFSGVPEVVPTGFGALKQQPFLGKSVHIVPGSETITRIVDRTSGRSVLMERAGYSGLGVAGGDQFVAQADLQPNQYTIDYSTGLVTFSDKDSTLLQAKPGGSQDLLVRYQFQTNRSTDVVRASYATRELMTAQLGLVQYEPRTGEGRSLQLTNRIHVRNTHR